MARRLPPLNPLRSFEVAARHNSFARAADELAVTPAAVSRQVKLLEDYFGVEFFTREAGGVSLTPEARAYASALSRTFQQIAAATDEFRTHHTSSILTVRGYTTFLVKWLVPRLPEFQKLHPQIKVRLTSGTVNDIARGEADIVFRYGGSPWPGFRAVLLFRDELVPVCSPALLRAVRGRGRLLAPAQIKTMPLLSLEARRQDWPDWFQQAGETLPREQVQSFADLAVVHEFARRGLGVALAQRGYIDEDLAAGNLVVISKEVLRRELGYYALASSDSAGRSKVAAFMDWLGQASGPDEAARTGARAG